jgi:hypothetical protein
LAIPPSQQQQQQQQQQQRQSRQWLRPWRPKTITDNSGGTSTLSTKSSSPLSYDSVFGRPPNEGYNPRPYVPDGLSADEYQQIKLQEANKAAKADYGAWGPRFQRTSTPPTGDWFLMRNLWTTGTIVNNSISGLQQSMSTNKSISRRNVRWIVTNLIVTWMLVETIVYFICTQRAVVPSTLERFILRGLPPSLTTTASSKVKSKAMVVPQVVVLLSALQQRLPSFLTALTTTLVRRQQQQDNTQTVAANQLTRLSNLAITLLTGVITYVSAGWALARLVGYVGV